MIESGVSESHGAGRIVGKDGSDDQTPWEPSRHSTLKPLTRLPVPKGESSVSVSSKPK